jgi:putative cell wall-binding protein
MRLTKSFSILAIAVASAAGMSITTSTVVPASASGALGTSAPEAVDDDTDAFPYEFSTGKPWVPTAEAVAGQDGFLTFGQASDNAFTYTVKLVASPRAELYRSTFQSVADELRVLGVAHLTIAPGQFAVQDSTDTLPKAHEVYVYTGSTSPCTGPAAGCAQPGLDWRATGMDAITLAGKVWVLPEVDKYSAQDQHHVVAHEIGHVLGLDHYSALYQGISQVMHPSWYDSSTYQAGDKNGLRYLSRDVAPVGALDSVAVPRAGLLRISGWAFDPDEVAAATVRITVDGAIVKQLDTDTYRADVNSAHGLPNYAYRGFDVIVGAPGGVHTVCVSVMNFPRGAFLPVGSCRSVQSPTSSARIEGANRYETAAAVSRAAFPSTAPVVVVADGENFPDALAAGPVAAKLGGSLLLTQGGALTAVTRSEINRLKPSKIIVVGGSAVISDAVLNDVQKLAPSVVRLAGADRYETSRKLAGYAFTSASTSFVASGDSFADALAAGTAAASKSSPLVLVGSSPTANDTAAGALLSSLKSIAVRVVGGTAVIADATIATLKTSVPDTARVSGADRYLTSAVVSKNYFPSATPKVYVVNGTNFPDGLVTAPLAARTHSPLFLSPGACIHREVIAEMDRLQAGELVMVGGSASLTPAVGTFALCG